MSRKKNVSYALHENVNADGGNETLIRARLKSVDVGSVLITYGRNTD